MPDTRTHRGAHPEDAALFAPGQIAGLRAAETDLCWLLDHGYAIRSSLALVGDRHRLTDRQRTAVARCACSEPERAGRLAREVPLERLPGSELWVDGYNLLITIETVLGGGVILRGRDGCFRDLASLHGTYRSVAETTPALERIGDALAASCVVHTRWLLDRPVSNSGRLRTHILEVAAAHGWNWSVDLEFSPDSRLAATDAIVATSDSIILDRCRQWTNLAGAIVGTLSPARVVDVAPDPVRGG